MSLNCKMILVVAVFAAFASISFCSANAQPASSVQDVRQKLERKIEKAKLDGIGVEPYSRGLNRIDELKRDGATEQDTIKRLESISRDIDEQYVEIAKSQEKKDYALLLRKVKEGENFIGQKKYAEAAQAFLEAQELQAKANAKSPETIALMHRRAYCLYASGNKKDAVALYEQTIQLHNKLYPTHLSGAEAVTSAEEELGFSRLPNWHPISESFKSEILWRYYVDFHQYDKAIDILNKAGKENFLAEVYEKKGDLKSAEIHWRKSMVVDADISRFIETWDQGSFMWPGTAYYDVNPNVQNLCVASCRLAQNLAKQNRMKESFALIKRCEKLSDVYYTPLQWREHVRLLQDCSKILNTAGKYTESQEMLNKAAKIEKTGPQDELVRKKQNNDQAKAMYGVE